MMGRVNLPLRLQRAQKLLSLQDLEQMPLEEKVAFPEGFVQRVEQRKTTRMKVPKLTQKVKRDETCLGRDGKQNCGDISLSHITT
jgi:hypothetical protein